MSNFKQLTAILISFSLVGCSYIASSIPNRNKEYLKAKSIPPLRIPPGISSTAFHNEYPVSDRDFSGSKNVNLVPPDL